jgi:hypothetical protein
MIEVKRKITEFVSEKYRKKGVVPSVRQILQHLDLNRTLFYEAFPGGLREVCEEAGVRLPSERLKLVKQALKAKERSAERSERGGFDLEFKRSELETKARELNYSFQFNTEGVKNQPYWRSRREQFNQLCDWFVKRLREVKEPSDLKALAGAFQKLKNHYVMVVGGLTLSDKIEEQKKLLMQLERRCLEYQRWQDATEKRYGVPLDEILPVISELATAKERFGLTVEQVQSTGQFVSQAAKVGWEPKTLVCYVAEHFQTLLDLDALHGEKRRLKSEIEELREERRGLLVEISNLEAENRRIAEEVRALRVVENSTAKILNQEMELVAKANINNILLGKMCLYGVDALVDGIQNDPRLQRMLTEASLNPSLHPQITMFAEIVQENADRIKQEITKLSLIASIVEKLQGKTEGSTSARNDEGDREKRHTPSELSTIFEPLGPPIFGTLSSDKYLGPRTSSVKSPH